MSGLLGLIFVHKALGSGNEPRRRKKKRRVVMVWLTVFLLLVGSIVARTHIKSSGVSTIEGDLAVNGTLNASLVGDTMTFPGGYRKTALNLTGGRFLAYLRAYNSTSRPSIEWIASNQLPMGTLQCHERADDFSKHNHCTFYTANNTGPTNSTLTGRLAIGFGDDVVDIDITNANLDLNGGNMYMDADSNYYTDNNNGWRFYTQTDDVIRFYPNNTQTINFANGGVNVTGLLRINGDTHPDGDLFLNRTATNKLRLPQQNTATNPTISFGDGDTGLYESADNVIKIPIGGTNRWLIDGSTFGASASTGGAILIQFPSSTEATLLPNRGDGNTGIGHSGLDNISIIAGAVEMMRGIERVTGTDNVYFPVWAGFNTTQPNATAHVNGDFIVNGVTVLNNATVTSDFYVAGNITSNEYYAETFVNETTGVTISAQGVWYNITAANYTSDFANGFNFSNGVLRSQVSGVFGFSHTQSFSGGANEAFHFSLTQNEENMTKCESHRKMSAGCDTGSSSGGCTLRVSAGDSIRAVARNADGTSNIDIEHYRLTVDWKQS